MPPELVTPKKIVPDFRHGENIHCDSEIPPHHLNYDISLPIIFLKIDRRNIIHNLNK